MSSSAAFGPPAGLEEAALPLGAPPLGQRPTGGFAFTAVQPDGDGPVAYSPCRPIHYVVRPDGAPAGGAELIRTAVARVSAATGLQFVDDGATQEAPSADREAYQPDVYGSRWAPVLIAWSTAAESPELAGEVAGIAGSASVTRAGRTVYVTGSVTLDSEDIGALAAVPGTRATALGVVTHELAHLVGLDHVDDPTQLMYPSTERRPAPASAPATSPGSPRSARASARRTSDRTLHTRSARPHTELPGRLRTLATDRVTARPPRSPSSTVARSCSCTAPGPRP